MTFAKSVVIVISLLVGVYTYADTIITLPYPDISVNADGKVVIHNAKAQCPDASAIVIDTSTVQGKAMYSYALASHMAQRQIYIQTGCSCNQNCGGQVVNVYKLCSRLAAGLCP